MQYQANSLIKQVNQFIDGSSADPIDKVGGAGADDEVYVQGPTTTTTMSEVGGIGNLIKSVPTMIGQAAVSVIRSVKQCQFWYPMMIRGTADGGSVCVYHQAVIIDIIERNSFSENLPF